MFDKISRPPYNDITNKFFIEVPFLYSHQFTVTNNKNKIEITIDDNLLDDKQQKCIDILKSKFNPDVDSEKSFKIILNDFSYIFETKNSKISLTNIDSIKKVKCIRMIVSMYIFEDIHDYYNKYITYDDTEQFDEIIDKLDNLYCEDEFFPTDFPNMLHNPCSDSVCDELYKYYLYNSWKTDDIILHAHQSHIIDINMEKSNYNNYCEYMLAKYNDCNNAMDNTYIILDLRKIICSYLFYIPK